MKKIAIVENLMANRPSETSIGSLPHSNGSAFTGVRRRGAISDGMNEQRPRHHRGEGEDHEDVGSRIGCHRLSRRPPGVRPIGLRRLAW